MSHCYAEKDGYDCQCRMKISAFSERTRCEGSCSGVQMNECAISCMSTGFRPDRCCMMGDEVNCSCKESK